MAGITKRETIMKTTTVNYHSNDGVRSSLCIEGRKFFKLVYIDSLVVCRKIPKSQSSRLSPLMRKGSPYPVARAVRQFKKAGKSLGITKSASNALRVKA
jgi:hypothetical protein